MHIELAELLCCPQLHEETFCVVSPDAMDGRTVVAGVIGCPVCHNEYTIREGVAVFATDPSAVGATFVDHPVGIDAPTTQALLNLSGPGGNVALVGSAALLAADLADLVGGVHFVACNAPLAVRGSSRVSVLYAPVSIPLRSSSMRGIVVGSEMSRDLWIEEAVRVLLRGTRFLCIGQPACPDGIRQLAVGDGIVVGEKV